VATSSAGLKTYEDTQIRFSYPDIWNVPKTEYSLGKDNKVLTLGIPGDVSQQLLSYVAADLRNLKPQDVKAETKITIGKRTGYKWLTSGENYVSYEYYSRGSNTRGSFYIHVTVPKENQDLEQQLDALVKSVVFKK
jgi:hypothetical protein